MKKNIKKIPISVLLMFAVASVLMVFSSVGAARALPDYTSGEYDAQVETKNIGISLLENGNVVSSDGEEGTILGTNGAFSFGPNPESLQVQNTGDIPEYVRVTVTKYWTEAGEDGKYTKNKNTASMDPSLIKLILPDGGDWIEDTDMITDERQVFYYKHVLEAGEVSSEFMTGITLDADIQTMVDQETETVTVDGKEITTITTTYDFDGLSFFLEVKADGVQTHNPDKAMQSAWGVTATFDGDNNLQSVKSN